MSETAKRSTIYFKALRADEEDLSAFRERAKEPTVTYEALLKDLKTHGKI